MTIGSCKTKNGQQITKFTFVRVEAINAHALATKSKSSAADLRHDEDALRLGGLLLELIQCLIPLCQLPKHLQITECCIQDGLKLSHRRFAGEYCSC